MQTIIQQNLQKVLNSIVQASEKTQRQITLVAVSKTKSVQEILEAYHAGQRHFGENYTNEIQEKAPQLPNDIKWHFIGHLQTNKVSGLLKIQNLEYVQSLDNLKLAEKLEKHCAKLERNLNVFVQIKLSEEESKTGAELDEAKLIIQEIITKFKFTKLVGLMTIGPIGNIEIFKQLIEIAHNFEKEFNLEQQLKLSMGMSGDYLEAINYGADFVRVGSAIFGERIKH